MAEMHQSCVRHRPDLELIPFSLAPKEGPAGGPEVGPNVIHGAKQPDIFLRIASFPSVINSNLSKSNICVVMSLHMVIIPFSLARKEGPPTFACKSKTADRQDWYIFSKDDL